MRAEVIAALAPKLMTATPALRDLATSFVYGGIWSRPGLSQRDRSIATIAAVVAIGAAEETQLQTLRGVENGLTAEEVSEILTQLVPYIGFPLVISAANRIADFIATLEQVDTAGPA